MKTNVLGSVVQSLIRLAVVWLVDALSLAFASWILPGLSFSAVGSTSQWTVLVAAAFLLATVNFLIRPIILLLARPLGWVALLVVGFLVNSLMIWLTAWLLPGFEASLLGVLLGGIVIAFFSAILTGILEIDEEGSWYQSRIERMAREHPFAGSRDTGVGLMLLEIDGLSYWHMKKAIDDGLMPTVQAMIDEDGYQVSLVDCGLPSMTSACQAGIMFGDNYDIPAYRWYDKAKKKVYVSASDATELNKRYAHGGGLMRGGSSILNMMNGDAEKSMFTMANMFEANDEEKNRRASDVSLLMLNPYFLTKALAIFCIELVREVWEGWQQKRKNVQPRLNRLEHWYPFVRASMCTLMRDISSNLAILDMMRGAPSIYMLYLGYDEVAHHSGPWTNDAFGDLKRLDRTFARLRKVVKERAPRPYDFIILSDHGQSFGPTFQQRYGISIKDFIEKQLPTGTSVDQQIGGDTGAFGLQGVAGELVNVQSTGDSGFDRTIARQGQKLAERGVAEADMTTGTTTGTHEASVVAYGSGNAAQVYFDLYPRKITMSELEAVYPGMIDAVVQHEGIGLVVGQTDDGSYVALGKRGQHNLTTGEVSGEDPVVPYAPASGHGAASVEKRVWQLRRVMEFPSAGDLWLFSTVYSDGTVAALEELIGNHGGMGGEQTDAFIFHPPQLTVPETRNSIDVFHILNNHRGAPVVEIAKAAPKEESVPDWALSTLTTGIGRVGTWLNYAVRCIFLEESAYEAVTHDPYMTGPALLIVLVMQTILSLGKPGGFNFWQWLATLGLFVLSIVLVHIAGYLLTRKGNTVRTFRALGFAQAVNVLGVLALFPILASFVRLMVLVLGFLSTWMGAAKAYELRGWRTLLLPVVVYLVLILETVIVQLLLSGAQFTMQSVLATLGLQP